MKNVPSNHMEYICTKARKSYGCLAAIPNKPSYNLQVLHKDPILSTAVWHGIMEFTVTLI